jgi:hypothetical protein
MDTCLSIGFVILVALCLFEMAGPRDSREVRQFIQMLEAWRKKL